MSAIKELEEKLVEEVTIEVATPQLRAKKPAGFFEKFINTFGWK
jgi:hypothetical protein